IFFIPLPPPPSSTLFPYTTLFRSILVPLQTARYRLIGTDRLRSITAQATDLNAMNLAMIEIERVLRRQHKIRPGQDNDFQIRNQTDILATFQQTTETFKYLLAGIAAVSLLVGGIGIMKDRKSTRLNSSH